MNSNPEHHVNSTGSIQFATVEGEDEGEGRSTGKKNRGSGVPGHREKVFHVKQSHFAMPSVTVSSDPRRAREKREREKRRCTAGRLFRCTILAFAIAYCKEISGFMNDMVPQTVISAPHIKRDYTSIKGVHDLSSEKLKPKCFNGVVDCPCKDPLVPVRGEGHRWIDTHLRNQLLTQSEQAIKVDVVFFGDSITEGWRETSLLQETARAKGSHVVFESFFSKTKGAKYNGLPLGIAGDTSPMLLWRMQNGELPANLNPSVFWLLIGTNDIGRTWCSPEMIVVGVIRNVEEILSRKPDSLIVLNGLLPRTYNKDGFVARGGPIKPSVWEDIKAINSELKMYATYREGVSYFDTKVFFKDPKAPAKKLKIDKKLMPDYLHPSAAGYRLWGEEIVKKLDALLKR